MISKILIIVSAILAGTTTGTLAQSHHNYSPDGLSTAREEAIHECCLKAEKYKMNTWQTTQFAVYGTCMGAHDQRP